VEITPVYKLKIKNVEVILTVKELEQLKAKIEEILSGVKLEEPKFPPDIPKDLSLIAKAMLAVCRKYHRGYDKRADASTIADEIAKEYPEVAKHYKDRARLVWATIFTANNGKGGGLVPKGLLKMVKENGKRKYWVE